jgi:hypothetical protein
VLGKTGYSFYPIHSRNRYLTLQWHFFSRTSVVLLLSCFLGEDGRIDENETSSNPSARRLSDAKFFI